VITTGIPHSQVDVPPLPSVKVTGVCLITDNSKILHVDIYAHALVFWSNSPPSFVYFKPPDFKAQLKFKELCLNQNFGNATKTKMAIFSYVWYLAFRNIRYISIKFLVSCV
jgi:hypothetical protein